MIDKYELKTVLLDNILSFWQDRMVDNDHGGFYGRIDGKGKLDSNSDKAIILNTRILWSFAAAYQYTEVAEHKALADRACHYITQHFFDKENGGVYWMLDAKGKVSNNKKQIYAQAFAIYALAEYFKISKDQKVLDQAIALFERVEKHSFDKTKNGYIEALDVAWKPLEDVRLSEKDMQATKTMNTHLHVLEAYTNLYRIWPDEALGKQLKNLIELMSATFLYDNGHFKLFFDDDWNLLSHEVSFGHDIEGSWLLCEAAEVLADEFLIQQTKKVALKMVNAALEGLDDDGGLMNEANNNGITDSDKHWWPQAEALVGLVNAWQVSGNENYLKPAEDVWEFIKSYLINEDGEWHWKVTREGKQTHKEDLAGPWKSCYHNTRAMLQLISRLP